jgi:methylase of polypeptide subunit release factors
MTYQSILFEDLKLDSYRGLKNLSEEQRRQVVAQLIEHRHERYVIDIALSDEIFLHDFVVHAGVMRPEIMSSIVLARFLAEHKKLVAGKTVLDMGSGSGIQGIVMGQAGAARIIFSDVTKEAVENTRENVRQFKLGGKSTVLQGDLFERVVEEVDIIVFNHPFFPDDPIDEVAVSRAMLDSGELIHRFLQGAKNRFRKAVVMPYFQLGGPQNDPGVQGPKHDYALRERGPFFVGQGLQRGNVSIYEMTRRDS